MNDLLSIKNLKKYYKTPAGFLHAVDDVSFDIKVGQTLGIVGESGCGKSTLGKSVLRLTPPTAGEILFDDIDIMRCSSSQMRKLRGEMQMIFQDPFSSLNPRMSVRDIIADTMIVNKVCGNKEELNLRVLELMELVGLPKRLENVYPHELDAGKRQRIGVARALSVNPKFIVCDEPVSALDVSIQAQVLNLLMDLQDKFSLTYMFITHDLSVVKHISDNIAVMYLGKCIEFASSSELFENPLHPYTKALFSAIPRPNLLNRGEFNNIIRGEVSSPINPKAGCRFATRCDFAKVECMGEDIRQSLHGENHYVACKLYE